MKLKNIILLIIAVALAIGMPSVGHAQATLNQTVLSASMSLTANTMSVGSATGFTANTTRVFVDREAMDVLSVSGTTITVKNRGTSGTFAQAHPANAVVFVGLFSQFYVVDPFGSCTRAVQVILPYVNIRNGNIWNCESVTGQWESTNLQAFGFGNLPFHTVNDAAYTAGLYDTVVNITHATAGRTITLPSVTGVFGKVMIIRYDDAAPSQTITIAGSNAQGVTTAAAGTTTTLTQATGAVIRLMSVGGSWVTF